MWAMIPNVMLKKESCRATTQKCGPHSQLKPDWTTYGPGFIFLPKTAASWQVEEKRQMEEAPCVMKLYDTKLCPV